jgi:hypothetical protein
MEAVIKLYIINIDVLIRLNGQGDCLADLKEFRPVDLNQYVFWNLNQCVVTEWLLLNYLDNLNPYVTYNLNQ